MITKYNVNYYIICKNYVKNIYNVRFSNSEFDNIIKML